MDSALPLIDALGWTLLHFLWQGTAVAAALWLFLRAGRPLSARSRYLAATVSLTAMIVWPALTFRHQDRSSLSISRPAVAQAPAGNAAPATPASLAANPQTAPAGPSAAPAPGNPVATAAESPAHLPLAHIGTRLQPAFPWIVSVWAAGVFFLSARFLAGWRVVQRVRRSGTEPDPVWSARLEALRQRLQISRPVSLLVSATAAMPMVIGWVKPVVLVPAGLFLGLSAAQLEAILAHELAHIRRQDYLINLCQAAVETVLFYHPAVWWVSARMREEREHCCDDIAATLTGSALAYARALTALEETRGLSSLPAGAVSAAGGSLLQRVQRLLGVAPRRPRAAAPWILGGLALLVAALAISSVRQAHAGAPAPDPESRAGSGMDVSLLRRWQALDAGSDVIPEKRIAVLRYAIRRFLETHEARGVTLSPEQVETLRALQSWQEERTQHTTAEVTGVLAAVLAIHRDPIQIAFNESPAPGLVLTEAQLAQIPFGPAGAKGVRAAFVITPRQETYVSGDEVSAVLHFWNSGPAMVVIGNGLEYMHGLARPFAGLEAKGADGREITVTEDSGGSASDPVLFTPTWQLRPGEVASISGYTIQFGEGNPRKRSRRGKADNVIQFSGMQSGEKVTVTATPLYPKAPDDTDAYIGMNAGTFTFSVLAPEDVKVWSTTGPGTWPMPGSVTLEVVCECFHATDILTTAVLIWPDGRRAVIPVAADAFANREPWALAWEAGRSEFWIAKGDLNAQGPRGMKGKATTIVRVDFSTPAGNPAARRVVQTRYTGWPDGGPSPECRSTMEKRIDVPAKGEPAGEVLQWPTVNPPTMQANWLTVTVSIQADGRCVISQDDGGPWFPDQLEAPLRARAAAARATWEKNVDLTTPVEPHALLFVPAAISAEAKQKVINACLAAGLAPADQSTGTAAQPDATERLHLVTTGSGFPGTEPEQHDLGEGTTIAFATRLYHGPNTDTRAIARWPARDGKPARYARFQVASDTMGHRQRWAAFWEEGQQILWIAPGPFTAGDDSPWTGGELHRFDLRDPDHIVEQIYNGFPAENGPSAALREKVASTLTLAADGEFQGHYRHWSVEGQNPPLVPSGQIFVFLRKDFRYQVGIQPECEVSALTECVTKEIGEREPPFEIAVHTPAGFPAAQEDAVVSALRDLQLVTATSSPPGTEGK